MPCKIYLWKLGLRGHFGHLSLELSDGTYISHWPDQELGKIHISQKPGTGKISLANDIEEQESYPDETLVIDDGILDENAMRSWWNKQAETGIKYNLLFQNCAQVVEKALRVGGILNQRFVSIVQVLPVRIAPREVYDWAEECVRKFKASDADARQATFNDNIILGARAATTGALFIGGILGILIASRPRNQ